MSNSIKQRKPKVSFSLEEDKLIQDFVHTYGYERIAELKAQIPNRTAKQIRVRYRLYLDQSVKHDEFSFEEDDMLIQCVQKFGKKWSYIAKMIPGRTDVQLKFRFIKLEKKCTIIQTQTCCLIIEQQTHISVQLQNDQLINQKSEDKLFTQKQFVESYSPNSQKSNEEIYNFPKIDEEFFDSQLFKTDSFEDLLDW
jgi:hypothetical protein